MIRILKGFFALIIGFNAAVALAADTSVPEQIVRQTTMDVLNAVRGEAHKSKPDPRVAQELVNGKILPIIDFPTFAKLVLGTSWQSATPAQRDRFTTEFQNMLIRTYSKYMLDYADTQVNYLPTRKDDRFVFVNTELVPGKGKTPLQVSYRFKEFDNGWRAVDVTVDGLSMAKNFRTAFTDEVSHSSLDALIDRLAKANSSGTSILPEPTKEAKKQDK